MFLFFDFLDYILFLFVQPSLKPYLDIVSGAVKQTAPPLPGTNYYDANFESFERLTVIATQRDDVFKKDNLNHLVESCLMALRRNYVERVLGVYS